MKDGSVRENELAYQRGGTENPMSTEDVLEKFQANAEISVSEGDAESLRGTVLGLEDETTLDGFGLLSGAAAQKVAA
jgi:hypothetical protein